MPNQPPWEAEAHCRLSVLSLVFHWTSVASTATFFLLPNPGDVITMWP